MKIIGMIAGLTLLLGAADARAQSTAQPVVPGYLTTSGCSYGLTTCFVQYGSSGPAGGTVNTLPSGVTSADASFTVASGGVYQTVLAASATRKGCTFQNPSTATEPVLFKFGTQATAYTISPGQSISCDLPNGLVEQSAVTATATTTSHAVAGNSQ